MIHYLIIYIIISYILYPLITAIDVYGEQIGLVKRSFMNILISNVRNNIFKGGWWLFALSPIMIPLIIIAKISEK